MAYPTPILIDALRKTANKIESGDWDNHWGTPSQCNCGLLARSILEEPLHFDSRMGCWRRAILNAQKDEWALGVPRCKYTGLSFVEIVDVLSDVGLRNEDIISLEHLGNEAIIEAMDTSAPSYYNDDHVVEYLRTWADLLEEAQPLAEEASESTAETAQRPQADPVLA